MQFKLPVRRTRWWLRLMMGAVVTVLFVCLSGPSAFAQEINNITFLPLVLDGESFDVFPQSDLAPLMPDQYDSEAELEPSLSFGELQAAANGFSSTHIGSWYSAYAGSWLNNRYNYNGYWYDSSFIKIMNESSHTMKVFWSDSSGREHHYRTLKSGRGYWQQSFTGHTWTVRDNDGNKMADFTAGSQSQLVTITDSHYDAYHNSIPEPELETWFGSGTCECDKGVVEMTLELAYRVSNADRDEQFRVRQGGLGGAVLFDSQDDGNDDPGLPDGATFTFAIDNPGEDIVITVQGKNHPSETVKARLTTDCNVTVGDEDGNSYINFKVADLKTDGDDGKCDALCEITAYEHYGYEGTAWGLGIGAYNSGDSTFVNDTISSFGIPEGLEVRACEHADGGGTCKEFTSSSNVPDHFNDLTSYIEVTGQCTPKPEPKPEPECDCKEGVLEMTLEIAQRTQYADSSERIRVREGGLNGEVLYDSYDDGNDHLELEVGQPFTFGIASPGIKIVVTVEGTNHIRETIKASFHTNCDVSAGIQNGNSYIMFRIVDVKTDAEPDICKPATASLGDKVWLDTNENGVQDGDEAGVVGVVVNLWSDDDGDGAPDTQINSTVTDENGMYLFDNLVPDLTYVVQFVAGDGAQFTQQDAGDDDTADSDPAADSGITGPITLESGEYNTTIDAGIVSKLAALGDTVWLDINANGVQDDGEAGVPEVTVNLWIDEDGDGAPDTQIDSTVTDGDGMYGFDGLDPDLTYVVQFVAPEDTVLTTQDNGDDMVDSDAALDSGITDAITLSAGEENTTIDAGLISLLASLGDYVWLDANRDGLQDEGESGVADVIVNLWTDDDSDGAPDTQIDATTTDENGFYSFTGLDSTLDYVVQFIAPLGSDFTSQDGGDEAVDSNPDPNTGVTDVIMLNEGESHLTIDAGLVTQLASLGDYVWLDANRDGMQGDSEDGVVGVVVNLWTDDDGDGAPNTEINSTVTDDDGFYGFTELDPNLVYVVQFVAPDNAEFTTQDADPDNAVDSDANEAGITGPISLELGGDNPTIDAGLVTDLASLGDYVWSDVNSDGQQGDDEVGVPDVVVNLWTDDDGDGAPDMLIDDTVTDVDGAYSFTGLDPALTYVVQFVAPDGTVLTTQDSGDDTSDSDAGADGITPAITLGSGENNSTIDAGLVTDLASLGDYVWSDVNSDGQQGDDEVGVPDVVVNLWTDDDGDGAPDMLIDDTVTDVDGAYSFTGLDPALTYVVQFVAPDGTVLTTQDSGDDTSDSDAGADGITPAITLGPDENNSTIDAGLVTDLASLGDYVWFDVNSDGQQGDDEVGVPDVVVNLWTDDDGDGAPDMLIDDTVTDVDGAYSFTGLDPALTYVVQFVAPGGTALTTQDSGDDTSDSDADPTTGITGPIDLELGENDPTIDAGLVEIPQTAGLGNYVWLDLNPFNGSQDATEDGATAGVENFIVSLWVDEDGDGIPDTELAETMTDAEGYYEFVDLDPAQTYIVQFVNSWAGSAEVPAYNYAFTMMDAGTDDALDSDADTTTGITAPINLVPGEFNPDIDAGVYPGS